ncbi:hypothetical protein DB330_06390 [Lacticaseibacillus casei]|uniref:Uncharacterized protein n=2 Tax=Lacticaseibacillus casei TaxID=1582 RepID=A0AAD1ESM7_LACCA|nr:hypothetical protein [Lacticaseibacillus casei]BAN74075.1 hypothetical protein LBCZ_0907 [Lacticaseibacillus casei DSM 20011 = JCM 1134 = ATCC 393]MBI6597577.1 hypothetical protein [Lacticaseibacillus casei]MBO2416591.1 hypothetical protein [Lacticaseibacillus casei]MCK2080956.1 hypothetical protein [Lacticaseibacillus casei]MDZ5495516.1 hypothetical protein [Lacticaseibacillus casei]
MMKLENYDNKTVKIILTDGAIITGYIDEWVPVEDSESGRQEITISPRETLWLAIGPYISLSEDEIKSIEVIK